MWEVKDGDVLSETILHALFPILHCHYLIWRYESDIQKNSIYGDIPTSIYYKMIWYPITEEFIRT